MVFGDGAFGRWFNLDEVMAVGLLAFVRKQRGSKSRFLSLPFEEKSENSPYVSQEEDVAMLYHELRFSVPGTVKK